MKHSIKHQIGGMFIALVALALAAIWFCNYFLLEEFYVSQKVKILKTGVEQLNSIEDLTDTENGFSQFCSANNLSVAVVSVEYSGIYTNVGKKDGEFLAGRLFGYLTELDDAKPIILYRTDHYVVQKNRDLSKQMDYVESWGSLNDGRSFIIRTPMDSIKDNVMISNRFYAYIGTGVIVLASIVIWYFTQRITKPITELTEISQKMAALEFDTKYESGGKNEIGVLGHNFNTMSEKLEQTISELKCANLELQQDIQKKIEVDEMRKEFLSNVSHELKTPIALIQGYAEGLQDNINDDEESRNFYCEVIIDEAAKMNTMVRNLLTLNQLEFGNDQVTMEQFDITGLIRGVIQSSQILIEQSQAEVIFRQKEPLYVWGDEFKVEEVVTNFLSNALNHVKYKRKIEIRCEQQNGNLVRTSVFNTGDPIPEEDIDKIWIKFYKVDKARTREYGGNGIGLSIVKAIMESMNQKCGVRNYENGVEFWFDLESKA